MSGVTLEVGAFRRILVAIERAREDALKFRREATDTGDEEAEARAEAILHGLANIESDLTNRDLFTEATDHA